MRGWSKASMRQAGAKRRKNVKHSKDSSPPAERDESRDETTTYEPKKQKEAIAIRRLAKAGRSERKIAKETGVSIEVVRDVLRGRH